MVTKCANPSCGTFFRYLRGGRLFLLEMPPLMPRSSQTNAGFQLRKRGPHNEYFWLCERCAKNMTVTPEGATGAITVGQKQNHASDPA